MYEDNSTLIQKLLNKMSQTEINEVVQKEGGTQLKLIVSFKGGGQALLKPMRFPRTQVVPPSLLNQIIVLPKYLELSYSDRKLCPTTSTSQIMSVTMLR